jgi:hypothetical protein
MRLTHLPLSKGKNEQWLSFDICHWSLPPEPLNIHQGLIPGWPSVHYQKPNIK